MSWFCRGFTVILEVTANGMMLHEVRGSYGVKHRRGRNSLHSGETRNRISATCNTALSRDKSHGNICSHYFALRSRFSSGIRRCVGVIYSRSPVFLVR